MVLASIVFGLLALATASTAQAQVLQPASGVAQQGGQTQFQISINLPADAFNRLCTFSLGQAPARVTATFSPLSVTVNTNNTNGATTAVLSVGATAPTGISTVAIQATCTDILRTAPPTTLIVIITLNYTLQIIAAPSGPGSGGQSAPCSNLSQTSNNQLAIQTDTTLIVENESRDRMLVYGTLRSAAGQTLANRQLEYAVCTTAGAPVTGFSPRVTPVTNAQGQLLVELRQVGTLAVGSYILYLRGEGAAANVAFRVIRRPLSISVDDQPNRNNSYRIGEVVRYEGRVRLNNAGVAGATVRITIVSLATTNISSNVTVVWTVLTGTTDPQGNFVIPYTIPANIQIGRIYAFVKALSPNGTDGGWEREVIIISR